MKRKDMDDMLMEVVGSLDYDLAKSLHPDLSEDPESVPETMGKLRRIVRKYLRKGTP